MRFKTLKNTKKELQEKQAIRETVLSRMAMCSEKELYTQLDAGRFGLSSEKAEEKLEEFGYNEIATPHETTIFSRLLHSLVNPFNVVLFLVAGISFFTDVLLSTEKDYATSVIILTLILFSSAIAFWQGEKSNSAAEKLTEMISNKADVWRDGRLLELPIDEIVPGDVVKLSAGDMLPGDVRFVSAKDAFVAQAALTGESAPVEKFTQVIDDAESLTDIKNLGFMGSDMVSGTAEAIVLSTGNDTYFGSMAQSLSGDKAKNSFERGVDSVSKLLLRFMFIMVPVILIVNGLLKGDWWNSLLFAVTIAVGLTPEMLPVIMTSTLAKGAVKMAKRKVIVKNLSAIQTFGEMDILCTDKTGTLTEDKIILEKYMDVHGNDDTRILRHAYLNSSFQTGLKNLIDIAIINRAKENGMEEIIDNFSRVDEIPFDFARRRMSVVLTSQKGAKRQLITKGAVEEVLACCNYVEYKGEIHRLKGERLEEAMSVYEKHNRDGLRVLAIAQKNAVADVNTFSVADEKEMVLLGFVGFLDPPKESAKIAIDTLKEHGVRTVVLTGDSEGVAVKVCNKVGVKTRKIINGRDVESMSDEELSRAIADCDLFAKLSPAQKERLVGIFQAEGHTVGYMGDGINDAQALRAADVGISVDSAVDIAKESSDMILLEKDLMVLEEGVIEGRRTFGNIMKYIKMAASGNFGNMFSVLVASIFLPFLPMLPIHILTQNLLCDFSQVGMPFDRVDKEYILRPRRWETRGISRFMLLLGPLSSLFDIACFGVLWWIMGFNTNSQEHAVMFQTGWFVFGTLSQILIVHMIRTAKIPILQSRTALPLTLSTVLMGVLTVILAFTQVSHSFGLAVLPIAFAPWLILLLIAYCVAVQFSKGWYSRRIDEWL